MIRGWLGPRAPGDSVRPRRPSGVVVRPLNFTVRGHPETRMRKILRLLGGWLFLSIVAAALVLLWSWPWRPHSALGWGVVLLGALPLTLLGEYLAKRVIFESPLGTRLDALGAGAKASALRVTYVLICVIVVGILGIYAFACLSKTGWLGAL